MKVKDLIWKLQQIYDKEKEVNFGTSREDEKGIHEVLRSFKKFQKKGERRKENVRREM